MKITIRNKSIYYNKSDEQLIDLLRNFDYEDTETYKFILAEIKERLIHYRDHDACMNYVDACDLCWFSEKLTKQETENT